MSGFSFFGDNPIFNMVRIGSLKMSHACAESVTWDRHVMHSGRTAQIIIEIHSLIGWDFDFIIHI